MATQSAEMNKMQEQIDQSEETVASAQQQIEDAQNQTTSYENLIKAYAAFQSGNYTSAANVLQNVQADGRKWGIILGRWMIWLRGSEDNGDELKIRCD